MSRVIRRAQLRRRKAPDDPRCPACWEARIPVTTALKVCPTCRARKA